MAMGWEVGKGPHGSAAPVHTLQPLSPAKYRCRMGTCVPGFPSAPSAPGTPREPCKESFVSGWPHQGLLKPQSCPHRVTVWHISSGTAWHSCGAVDPSVHNSSHAVPAAPQGWEMTSLWEGSHSHLSWVFPPSIPAIYSCLLHQPQLQITELP